MPVATIFARRGNCRSRRSEGTPKAIALLGYLYEHGFGAPQAYIAAADLYAQAAVTGNPFAQAMLGLMFDKGHGVPQDFVLAYKWLNLAAARTQGHERRSLCEVPRRGGVENVDQ